MNLVQGKLHTASVHTLAIVLMEFTFRHRLFLADVSPLKIGTFVGLMYLVKLPFGVILMLGIYRGCQLSNDTHLLAEFRVRSEKAL